MITASIVKTKNKGWDDLKKYLKQLTKDSVEVGYFNDQGIYPSDRNTEGWTYAQLMAYHELQCDQNLVPLRPIFGSITPTQMNKFKRTAGKMLTNGLRGSYYHGVKGYHTPEKLYSMLGIQYGEMIRSRFGVRNLARNKASTIKKKGSRLPMIETGKLRDAVSYKTSKQRKSLRVYRGF